MGVVGRRALQRAGVVQRRFHLAFDQHLWLVALFVSSPVFAGHAHGFSNDDFAFDHAARSGSLSFSVSSEYDQPSRLGAFHKPALHGTAYVKPHAQGPHGDDGFAGADLTD